jgi:integration host factor subunit alpha
MTITKASLINSVQNKVEISRTEAAQIIEVLLETVKRTLASGEDILISGFGKFCVKEKKGRRGRNPQTGEDLFLDARRVVTFQSSTVLTGKMNSDGKE